MEGFWMVLGAGEPVYRHTTLMSARMEAERLARISPGCQFHIMKSIAVVKVQDVAWKEYTFANSDGSVIPF